jgi:tetratricopeptide (TPR) repeat protein
MFTATRLTPYALLVALLVLGGGVLPDQPLALAQSTGDYYNAPPSSYGSPNDAGPSDNQAPDQPSDQALEQYSSAVQQAAVAYNQGNMARCIQLYEAARSLGKHAGLPDSSTLALYNNLAAAYIKRGNDAIRKQHNNASALTDFRKAVYLLSDGLPEGIALDLTTKDNQRIANNNLTLVSQNLQLPTSATGLLKQANALRLQGQLEPAVVDYKRAVMAAKLPADTSTKLAAYQAMGDIFNVLALPDKSSKYLALASQSATVRGGSSSNPDLLLQLATSQQRSGQTDQAVATLNKVLEASPNNRGALGQLEGIWRNELQYNPQSTVALGNLAGVLQKQNRPQDALAAYQAAEQVASQDPKIDLNSRILLRLNQGTLYQQMQRYREALGIYDSVLKANPNHPQASYYKATLYQQAGQTQDAIALFYRLLASNPSNGQAKQALWESLTTPTQAPEVLTQNLQGYGDHFASDPIAQASVGEWFHQHGTLPLAVQYYQRALALNPGLASAHANLATALASQGNASQALAEANQALRLEPTNATYKQLLSQLKGSGTTTQASATGGKTSGSTAKVPVSQASTGEGLAFYDQALNQQNAGATTEALALFEKAIVAEPNNRVYWSGYAMALQAANKTDKALSTYQKALALPPVLGETPTDAAPVYYGYGTLLQQKGRLNEALAQFLQAVKLDNQYKDAFYALGIVQEKLKHPTEAKTAFGRFVALSKANPASLSPEDKPLLDYAKSRLTAGGR